MIRPPSPPLLALALAAGLGLPVPVVAAPAAATLAADAGAADERDWRLANGLRVLVVEAKDPAAWLFIPAGWDADPPEARGVAELTAACAPAATREHDIRTLDLALGELGAGLVPTIAADYAAIRLSAPDATRLVAALPLLGQVATAPAFPRAALDGACAALLQGLRETAAAPSSAAARAFPAAFGGIDAPAAGIPDPWAVRHGAASGVPAFHARHWGPEGSVLAVSGVDVATLRAAADSAFGSWQRAASPPAVVRQLPGPVTMPLIEAAGPPAIAVGLARAAPSDARGALAGHALIHVLATRLGSPERVSAPLPATGHDTLVLPASSPARMIARVRRELSTLEAEGPTAAEMEAWRAASRAAEAAAQLADPTRSAFVAGLVAFRGLPEAAMAGLEAVSPADVQARLAVPRTDAWAVAVAAPPRQLARIREAGSMPASFARPGDGTAVAAALRGEDLVRRALAAQGDPARLLALASVDERAEGMFHGIGTHIAVRTRTVLAPPGLVYLESAMINHHRYIVNRLVDGQVWVDRTAVGTRLEHRFDKARLLERQALVHPAFALAQLSRDAWLRHAGPGPDPGTELVEALHPAAGACRLTLRTDDLTMSSIEMDLAPLDATTELHRFADFRLVDGIRLPHADSTTAAGRPLRDLLVTSVSFPVTVDRELFANPGIPDRAVFDEPGPADGPLDGPAQLPGDGDAEEALQQAPE